ncbi:MAG: DNA-processing protein DprA, partial [Clostridia bacterium]|nr:DNA-processing protein DprA [Clostridia bacterium]
MENSLYWLWLSQRLGQGNTSFVALLEQFGNPRAIYEASEEELLTFKREFGEAMLERLFDKNLDEAYSLEEYCVRKRVKILHYGAKDYPKQLTNLKNPPIILYARGKTEALGGKLCVGVVGTRDMTDYGRDAAYRMGYELAAAGAVVV